MASRTKVVVVPLRLQTDKGSGGSTPTSLQRYDSLHSLDGSGSGGTRVLLLAPVCIQLKNTTTCSSGGGDGTFGDLRPKLIEMEVFDQCRLFVLLQHGFPFSIVSSNGLSARNSVGAMNETEKEVIKEGDYQGIGCV
ncbi:hypothetical protein E3N88_09523 [Mikania micrantha]|uniref:Uncharacterized protein n=1 Tax=Mikania micrantha TaxID=192012 RepID=A0A5N6PK65_9ASTR|nr:hypothetical protein E3N88_09523 [Mikania micrantha]